MKLCLHRWTMVATCALLFGCGGGSPGGGASATVQQSSTANAENTAQRMSALQVASVPLPTGSPARLDSGTVATAAQAALVLPGSRGAFDDFHRNFAPLLPSPILASTSVAPVAGTAKALALIEEKKEIVCVANGDNNVVINGPEDCIIVVNPPPPPPDPNCPVVCATACAQAEASAYAVAWAHASATACAWAQAWACVYNGVFPFNRVCAWAQSQACFTAFTAAFAAGWDKESERRCEKRCTDGKVWQWVEKPMQGAAN